MSRTDILKAEYCSICALSLTDVGVDVGVLVGVLVGFLVSACLIRQVSTVQCI